MDQNRGITGFVVRCYEKILEREFDVQGLNGWCTGLVNNTISFARVVAGGFLTRMSSRVKMFRT